MLIWRYGMGQGFVTQDSVIPTITWSNLLRQCSRVAEQFVYFIGTLRRDNLVLELAETERRRRMESGFIFSREIEIEEKEHMKGQVPKRAPPLAEPHRNRDRLRSRWRACRSRRGIAAGSPISRSPSASLAFGAYLFVRYFNFAARFAVRISQLANDLGCALAKYSGQAPFKRKFRPFAAIPSRREINALIPTGTNGSLFKRKSAPPQGAQAIWVCRPRNLPKRPQDKERRFERS